MKPKIGLMWLVLSVMYFALFMVMGKKFEITVISGMLMSAAFGFFLTALFVTYYYRSKVDKMNSAFESVCLVQVFLLSPLFFEGVWQWVGSLIFFLVFIVFGAAWTSFGPIFIPEIYEKFHLIYIRFLAELEKIFFVRREG